MTDRPSYSTSKRAMWVSGGAAWVLIYIIVVSGVQGSQGALALAPTVIPAMVLMIISLLGVHRAFGSVDMRTMHGFRSAPRKRPARAPVEGEPPQ